MAIAGSVFGRIHLADIDNLPFAVFQLAKKTALIAFMAGGAVAPLFDREQDGIVVAVHTNLMYDLNNVE